MCSGRVLIRIWKKVQLGSLIEMQARSGSSLSIKNQLTVCPGSSDSFYIVSYYINNGSLLLGQIVSRFNLYRTFLSIHYSLTKLNIKIVNIKDFALQLHYINNFNVM